MKGVKLFLAALIGLSVATEAGAQILPFKTELAIGASFGVNFSSISFIPKVQQSMLMGYTGGFTARVNTEKNVGLQMELNFTQQGWKEKFDDPSFQYSRTINYVELPFFTHIYFGNKRANFFVNVGPKIGYAISESTKENLNGAAPNKTNDQHAKPLETSLDWGLCGGPGLEIRTGIGYFLLEGRYYYALGNIYKSSHEDIFPQSSAQVFGVKLTYLIPISKK
ncbi:MAG: porin family protein [Tannerellaceae bacterium]